MAVNHDSAMIRLAFQKLAPDPAHVHRVLLVQRHARPDARMDEQIVADPPAHRKRAQPADHVAGNDGAGRTHHRSLIARRDDLLRHAKALERFPAAVEQPGGNHLAIARSEEHTSELQSLMRISYAVFCLKKKIKTYTHQTN